MSARSTAIVSGVALVGLFRWFQDGRSLRIVEFINKLEVTQ